MHRWSDGRGGTVKVEVGGLWLRKHLRAALVLEVAQLTAQLEQLLLVRDEDRGRGCSSGLRGRRRARLQRLRQRLVRMPAHHMGAQELVAQERLRAVGALHVRTGQ